MATPESLTSTEDMIDALLDDPKAAFRIKLLRSTRTLLVAKGLDVSMDDIAEAAGLNRRTLFRHVESRDSLIADALSSAMDWYVKQLEGAMPADQPLDTWITNLAARLLEVNHAAGRGLWQLAASRDEDLPPALVAVNVRRRKGRKANARLMGQELWQRAGGSGPCPQVIVDAVAITISSFTTHSMIDDFGRSEAALARSVGTMLATLARAQVADQATEGPSTT